MDSPDFVADYVAVDPVTHALKNNPFEKDEAYSSENTYPDCIKMPFRLYVEWLSKTRPYVALDFLFYPIWNPFAEHLDVEWDFYNLPEAVENQDEMYMVMTLKSWLVQIGALDFDLT